MAKLTTNQDPDHATARECIAHRCDKHDGIDTVMREDCTLGDGAECAYCLAQRVVWTLVTETLFPIVLAFERASGQLLLLGVNTNPRTAPLFQILEALERKTADRDFEIVAQKLIGDVPVSDGPKEPQ